MSADVSASSEASSAARRWSWVVLKWVGERGFWVEEEDGLTESESEGDGDLGL